MLMLMMGTAAIIVSVHPDPASGLTPSASKIGVIVGATIVAIGFALIMASGIYTWHKDTLLAETTPLLPTHTPPTGQPLVVKSSEEETAQDGYYMPNNTL